MFPSTVLKLEGEAGLGQQSCQAATLGQAIGAQRPLPCPEGRILLPCSFPPDKSLLR